ncbi:MAG: hypothetical protein AABZ33_09735 [Chloroflexota bacterium]
MRVEATSLAQQGYTPTSQSWAPGQYGCGAFLGAVLLMFLLVGILIFIYMLIVKPAGTLTVTYVLQSAVTQPPVARVGAAAAPAAGRDLASRLAQVDEALRAGTLNDEEHAMLRAKILDDA